MVALSVLDQSFTSDVASAGDALQQTIKMAQHCESLGYKRFWVSEHHAFKGLAGSAPEILMAALGAQTESIRLGSGGVMLPHYSAYKVAETFSLLANLYPERIDLGIGRAPGADMSTAVALAPNGQPDFQKFPEQVAQLLDYLDNPNAKPLVSPAPPEDFSVWMLGSSSDSASFAAHYGLPYNLGLFINPGAAPAYVQRYRERFRASRNLQQPYTMITCAVFCADTEEEAKLLQHTFDVNFFLFVTGQTALYSPDGSMLNPEQASAVPVSAALEGFAAQRNKTRAVGTPEQVVAKLKQLVDDFQADELMLVSNSFFFESRKRCFELLAETMLAS